MTPLDWQQVLLLALLGLCGLKAILGAHFPWERCQCCGKRWGDHNKEGDSNDLS